VHVGEWVAGELIVITLAGHLLVWAWQGWKRHETNGDDHGQ
jgi:hypothetical protein